MPWKWIRRIGLILSLIGLVLSIVVLLQVTVSNPTGRRYSSSPVLMVGTSNEIGASAEKVLAEDLGLPNNNDAGRTACVCSASGSIVGSRCQTCLSHTAGLQKAYRIPDFVGEDFIVESKNLAKLPVSQNSSSNFKQIEDMAKGAKQLGIPLWVYVRKDTWVADDYYDVVESTGGGIVKYFVDADYHDLTDLFVRVGLVVCIPGLLIFGAWEFRTWRKPGGGSKAPRLPVRVRNEEEADLDEPDMPILPPDEPRILYHAAAVRMERRQPEDRPAAAVDRADEFMDEVRTRARKRIHRQRRDD